MFGRMMNETLGKLHFYLTFIGVYADLHAPCIISASPQQSAAAYSDFTNFDFLGKLLARPHLHDPCRVFHWRLCRSCSSSTSSGV